VCNNITSSLLNGALFLVVMINHFNPHNNDGECNSVFCIHMFLFTPISQSMHICANTVTQNMLPCPAAVFVFVYFSQHILLSKSLFLV
jgi:hypothetical protein